MDKSGDASTFYIMYQHPDYVVREGLSFWSGVYSGYDGKAVVKADESLYDKIQSKWTEKGKVKLLKPMLRGAKAASTLRDRVVKLAYDHKDLRPHILPLLDEETE